MVFDPDKFLNENAFDPDSFIEKNKPAVQTFDPDKFLEEATGQAPLQDVPEPVLPPEVSPARPTNIQTSLTPGTAVQGAPPPEFQVEEEQRASESLPALTPKRAAKDVAGGVVGVVSGAGGVLEAVGGSSDLLSKTGIDTLGKIVSEYGEEAAEFYRVEDPGFFDFVLSGAGSAATFLVPGLGVTKGVGLVTQAPKIAAALGITVSSFMEAAIEGGSSYNEAIADGKGEEEARKVAAKVFGLNVPVLLVTNKLGALFDSKAGGVIKKAVRSAPAEAFQEGFQEVASAKGAGKPVDPGSVATAAGVGGIVGGGSGLAVQSLQNIDQGRAIGRDVRGVVREDRLPGDIVGITEGRDVTPQVRPLGEVGRDLPGAPGLEEPTSPNVRNLDRFPIDNVDEKGIIGIGDFNVKEDQAIPAQVAPNTPGDLHSRAAVPDQPTPGKPFERSPTEKGINRKHRDIRGEVVKTPEDVAAALKDFRNPREELLHFVYTDDSGKIVAHTATTTGEVGQSSVDEKELLFKINDRARRSGATGIYAAHNHPGGRSNPSTEDVNFTIGLKRDLGDKFKGHVTLDHDEMSFIDPSPTATRAITTSEIDLGQAYTDESAAKITSTKETRRLVETHHDPVGDKVGIFVISTAGKPVGFQEVSLTPERFKRFPAIVDQIIKAKAGRRPILSMSMNTFREWSRTLSEGRASIKQRVPFLDIVIKTDNGKIISLMDQGGVTAQQILKRIRRTRTDVGKIRLKTRKKKGQGFIQRVFEPEPGDIKPLGEVGRSAPVEKNRVGATSIPQVPALFKSKTDLIGKRNLDLGGGKFDKGTNFLKSKGKNNFIIDIDNRSAKHNARMEKELTKKPADSATLANVLNTIQNKTIRHNVLNLTARLTKPGGNILISTFEKDQSGVGKKTSIGTFQSNRTTASYLSEVKKVFPDAHMVGKDIVATNNQDTKVVGAEDINEVFETNQRLEDGYGSMADLATDIREDNKDLTISKKIVNKIPQSRGAGKIPGKTSMKPAEVDAAQVEFMSIVLSNPERYPVVPGNPIVANPDYVVAFVPNTTCLKGKALTSQVITMRRFLTDSLPKARTPEQKARNAAIKTAAARKLFEAGYVQGLETPCLFCYTFEKQLVGFNAKPMTFGMKTYKQGQILKYKQGLSKTGIFRGYGTGDFTAGDIPSIILLAQDLQSISTGFGIYTKNLNFVEIMGDVGIKINVSTAGTLNNGLPVDVVAPYAERYPNVAVMYVAVNEQDLIQAGEDDRVHKIIPTHLGGGTPADFLTKMTGEIYENFQRIQGEKVTINGKLVNLDSPGTKKKFGARATRAKNIVDKGASVGTTKAYLKAVEEASRVLGTTIDPKFKKYKDKKWYHKLIGVGGFEYGKTAKIPKIDMTKMNTQKALDYMMRSDTDIDALTNTYAQIARRITRAALRGGVDAVNNLDVSKKKKPAGLPRDVQEETPRFSAEAEDNKITPIGEFGKKTDQVGDLQLDIEEAKTPDFKEGDKQRNFPRPKELKHDVKVLDLPVEQKANALDYLRTPEHVLRKMGLGKEADLLKDSAEKYLKDKKDELRKIIAWQQRVPGAAAAKNIFVHLDGRKVNLSAEEQKVADEIQNHLSQWASKLNLPKDRRILHYITHIFEIDFIEKEFDPDIAKLIADKQPGSVYDPFLQERLGKKGYVENVWRALQAYTKRATRKFNMDPALDALKEASKVHPAENENFMRRLTQRVNLRPTEFDNLLDNMFKTLPKFGYKLGQRPVNVVTNALRRVIYRGALGLNFGSAVRNLTQGVNTYAVLGERWTFRGYYDLAQKGSQELIDNGVLDDTLIEDRSLNVYQRAAEKVDPMLFYFFQQAEMINRGAAYYGAKAKALNQGKSEAEAVKAGKRLSERTQFKFGAVDSPVALASDFVRLLAVLQTFNIKQIEFLASLPKDTGALGVLRWTGATVVAYATIGKALGWAWSNIIPSFRLDVPGTDLITGLIKFILAGDKAEKRGAAKELAKGIALVIPGGVQAKKTLEGAGVLLRGFSKSPAGRVRFPVDITVANVIKGLLFGQWSFADAREHFRKNRVPLGEVQTEIFKQIENPKDRKDFFEAIQEGRKIRRDAKLAIEGE